MKSSDQDEIRKVFEEVYAANVRSGNLQGYASMYTENALWMPPGVPDRRGTADIVEGFAAQIAQQDIDPIFTAEEIKVIGDFGYVIGMSQATIRPKDGTTPRQANFRALWLMKKEQGIWKIDRQIWNSKPV
ncbi:YybH family protein [Nostoc sp. CALU 546]|uniref:YybH family protein n=1 Tax=Nostoc sp. CALU 546 TaxID=1867241 RepID=UPI003B67961F